MIQLFLKMALSKEEMIFKQMTDNINEPFLIVIDKSYSFSFSSYARGYQVYITFGILLMEK